MRQQTRRLALAFVLAPVATAGLASAPADARDPQRHTVRAEASFHDPGHPGFSNPGLNCTPDREGLCALVVDGVTSWTGDWKGTTTYHATGYQRRPGEPVRWEVWEDFTGTIEGCGTGKFSWYGTGTLDVTKPDPATQTFPMEGTLQLVGPGEGGLEEITGRATVSARLSLAPGIASQRGRITGEVTCKKGR